MIDTVRKIESMILGWVAYRQSQSANIISSSSKNQLIRWRGLTTYAACLCIHPGVIAAGLRSLQPKKSISQEVYNPRSLQPKKSTSRNDRYWSQQTSRSSHLSLMFSYHHYYSQLIRIPLKVLLLLSLLYASIHPSFDTEQQRSEVLPYPRLLSDHRSIPMSSVRMRVRPLRKQLWELSSEKEIKVELQQRSNLMFMMQSIERNGWMEMNDWMMMMMSRWW